MLVRDKHGRYETIDYRETAPAAASRDMYGDDDQASIIGGLAVGVPGELRGLQYLHRKYGVSLFAPSACEHRHHIDIFALGAPLEDSCHAFCAHCPLWFSRCVFRRLTTGSLSY
jgi:hypothetical protein